MDKETFIQLVVKKLVTHNRGTPPPITDLEGFRSARDRCTICPKLDLSDLDIWYSHAINRIEAGLALAVLQDQVSRGNSSEHVCDQWEVGYQPDMGTNTYEDPAGRIFLKIMAQRIVK